MLAEKYNDKAPTAKRQFQHKSAPLLLSHPSWWISCFSSTLLLWTGPPSPLSEVLCNISALFPFQSFPKFGPFLFFFFLIALNMSLYITQQQIYLNVSMLLLSRSGCMLQFKPVSGSHALLPDAPSTSGPSKRPGKENEVQLYRQSTDLSRTVSLAIHVKKQTTMKKQHIKIPQITKKIPWETWDFAKKPTQFSSQSGSGIRCYLSSIFCLVPMSLNRSPSSKWSSKALKGVLIRH